MNNRNVATKEIFSVLHSERGSASDISTQPQLSEHSGWQLRGFGQKNKRKETKTKQQTSETKQKVVFFSPLRRVWVRITWQVGGTEAQRTAPGCMISLLHSQCCSSTQETNHHRQKTTASASASAAARGQTMPTWHTKAWLFFYFSFFYLPSDTNKITSCSQTLFHCRHRVGAATTTETLNAVQHHWADELFRFPHHFLFFLSFHRRQIEKKKLPTIPCCVHEWALIGGSGCWVKVEKPNSSEWIVQPNCRYAAKKD